MKFSTSKSTKFIKTGYWLLLVLVGGFYLFHFFISIEPVLTGKEMIVFTAFVGAGSFFWYLRAKYFEYDSSGEVLIFVNKGVLLTELFNYREDKAEFPKAKLYNFKIKNYIIYKPLYIYVRSKDDSLKKVKFDVTFVSTKRLGYLKQSLNKVIRQNKID